MRPAQPSGLCPVTLLELLARPAPARVVAPDLLLLVDVPRLDLHRHVEHLLLRVLERRARRSGRGCRRQSTRLIAAAAVLQTPRPGRLLLLEAVRALVLD